MASRHSPSLHPSRSGCSMSQASKNSSAVIFFGHLQAIEKLAAVVLGVPEINDCENDENDQKSDKNSHLISPSPSVRSRQSLSFCNVIFVQFVSDFSCLFFGQLNNRTASFQPCGCSGMSVPNHPAGGSSSQDSASAQSFSLFQPRAHGNIVAAELNTEASEVFREGACIMESRPSDGAPFIQAGNW